MGDIVVFGILLMLGDSVGVGFCNEEGIGYCFGL